MKTWLRCFVWILEGLIVLGVIYFEPTCCVRGALWREAFFEGKPTSYWRGELMQWTVTKASVTYELEIDPPIAAQTEIAIFDRVPTWLERWCGGWFSTGPVFNLQDNRPRLLLGAAAAEPVLRELLYDSSPHVRQIARIGLNLEPER